MHEAQDETNAIKKAFFNLGLFYWQQRSIMQYPSDTKNSFYKSSDLSLVSAILSTHKAEIVGSRRLTPYRFEFHLIPLDICLELERSYINGQLMVSAKAIADNVRLLKSLIKGA